MSEFKRNVLITNPNSSKALSVERDVLDVLSRHGVPYKHIETEHADRESNIQALSGQSEYSDSIRKGDKVVVASGDGVVNQTASAIYELGIESTTALGFLSYGSFNDNAREHNKRNTNILDLFSKDTKQVKKSPLEMTVDGSDALLGMQYITIGWTAHIAKMMSDPEVRATLTNDDSRFIKSMFLIALQYATKHKHTLPSLLVDGDKNEHTSTTDFIARNGMYMGRVFQGSEDFSQSFKTSELHDWSNPKNSARDLGYIAAAGVNFLLPERFMAQLPGDERTSASIHFQQNGKIPVQADGEVITLNNPKHIEITKSDRTFSILHTK